MDNTVYTSYTIEDRSYVSFIKREIHNLVTRAGFSSVKTGEIDIVVSELTSNLIKHADKGELIYRLSEEESNIAFEIYCFDDGPGSNDIPRMMKDGFSSSNTLGHGLGSIKRLSDFFQIYSRESWGTVVYSKSYREPIASTKIVTKNNLLIKVLQLCIPGEKVCGDGYDVKKTQDETLIFLADGLGHGVNAHEAVKEAIKAFQLCQSVDPAEIIRFIHPHVKKTRGLVGTVAVYHHSKKQWRICGVGNITTRLFQGITVKNCMPHNGIIGLNIPGTLTNIEVSEPYQGIIMFSDGIRNRFNLSNYPSVIQYDPSLIASIIFKDNARRNDDMTVLVGKVC
jgi:anti-sigma regulatory factor (Ser/Thr protein kinase)